VNVPNIVPRSSPWGQAARHLVSARALLSADQSLRLEGRTELEPNCAALASSSRPHRRRNRSARPLQRRRLQQHRSLLGLQLVDYVAARQGMIRIRSDLAHAWPGRSFHLHSENTRCGTGVQRHGRRRFPVSEISCYFSDEPACAVRRTGRTPVRDRVTRRIADCRSPSHGAADGAAPAVLSRFGIRINDWYGGTLGRASIPHKVVRSLRGWRLLVVTTKRQG
jgi:hypothetical protein